jgi:hypothetical protein
MDDYQQKRLWASVGMFFVAWEAIGLLVFQTVSILGLVLCMYWCWIIYDAIRASGIDRFWRKFFFLERNQ